MRVPLSVHPVEKNNTETFDIWSNGKYYSIDAPIKPYFYSYKDNLPVPSYVEIEKVRAIALSDFKEKTFYKYSFNTRRELVKYRNRFTFEDNIPFTIRNRIDNPDIFTKYAHTDNLKFLFLDIEQYCPPGKLFPDYDDIITAISWCSNDRKIKSIYLKKSSNSDKNLLLMFIDEWRKINPDVVVVYNKSYDLPTIFNRCIRNKINPSVFSKSGKRPYYGGKDEIHIDGTVIYDVYESAKADQSLTGRIPDRKLKTVSNWFGFEETRKPLTPKQITELKGTRELVEYNRDDVRRLLVCFDVYWRNIEFNANDLKIPLSEAIQLKISDLGLITIGDEYKRLSVISDGTNYQRYPEIFQRRKKNGEKNYQGALVGIYKVGYFSPVYKADYSSLYPSIMASFNFSPDTTRLIEYKDYTGNFSIKDNGDSYIYTIPDNTLKKDVIIQVLKKPGFLSNLVAKFLRERSEYKKKWKETGNPIYRALSDNRKLKANGGVYGNMGYVNHPFGFTPIAIATTGIGRECAKLLTNVLNELYGDCVIDLDTDGIHFTYKDKVNATEVSNMLNNAIKNKFGRKLNLSVDVDYYDAGYFYKAKNYVLKKGDKIIYHGVALTSSSHTKMKKEFIHDLAEARLSQQDIEPIISKYMTLDFPLDWFAMNVKLGMPISSYKNKNSIACRMALDAEKHLGIKPQVGNQYFYIKSIDGYKLYDIADKSDIDYKYYKDELKKVVDIFTVDNPSNSIEVWI